MKSVLPDYEDYHFDVTAFLYFFPDQNLLGSQDSLNNRELKLIFNNKVTIESCPWYFICSPINETCIVRIWLVSAGGRISLAE